MGNGHGEVAHALEGDRGDEPNVQQPQIACEGCVQPVYLVDAGVNVQEVFVYHLVVGHHLLGKPGIAGLPCVDRLLDLGEDDARHLHQPIAHGRHLCREVGGTHGNDGTPSLLGTAVPRRQL